MWPQQICELRLGSSIHNIITDGGERGVDHIWFSIFSFGYLAAFPLYLYLCNMYLPSLRGARARVSAPPTTDGSWIPFEGWRSRRREAFVWAGSMDGWEAQLLLLVQYGFVQFVHDMYLCATCASCECKTRKCTSYAIFKTALVYFKRTEA